MADPQMSYEKFADKFYDRLKDPDPRSNPYRQWARTMLKDHPNGLSDQELATAAQKQFPDAFGKIQFKDTGPPPARGAESTYGTAFERGVTKGAAGLDVFGANVLGLGATAGEALHVPGAGVLRRGEKFMRERGQEAERYGSSLPAPVGAGQTIASAVPEAALKMVPYAAARTPAGLGMTAAVEAANRGPQETALAAGEGWLYGKMMPRVERIGEKYLSKVGVPKRMAGPATVGVATTGVGLASGQAPAEAVAGGLVGAGLSARRKRPAEPKAAIEAKTEAPPAPRAPEAPPAAEQIAGLPSDQLEVAHTKAVQQADKLRLSVEKANVGLRGAESRLRSLQERKDNLELGTTPATEKDLNKVEKDLAAQTEHVKKLKARHAEIADQHRQWQDAATAARTRGQQMKAPWAGASEAPPEARREHTAPIPEARRIESARQPMAATGLPPALPPPSRPEMAKDVGVPIAPYPPTARPAPPEIPKALPAPSGLPSTPPAEPQVMAPEQIQAIAQKHGVRPSELADLAQQDPRTIGTNLLKLMQARKTLAKKAPAGGAGAPGAAPVETMEQINGRIAAYQEILKAKSPGGAPPKEQPPQKGTAPPEVRAATETKEPVAETKAPKTETKPAAAEPAKMVAPSKLSAGVHYTVEKDNDIGLYPGDDVVYGGTSRGKHSFTIHEGAHRQVILIDAKDTPIEDVMKVLGEPAPPPEPRKAKGKKKEGPKHQRREEPDKDSTATDDPGFFGKLKNKAGELIHEGMQKVGVEDKPEYSEAYSRLTHQPLIVAKDPKQFEELAPGDVGATFFKAGDLGVKSGPLGNVVREQLGKGEGPISVVHPDVEKTDPMLQSGVITHEAIHQFVGEKNPVPVDEFMAALPPNIADRIRQHRSGRIAPGELGDELPARLGASGLGGAGGAETDPRKTQEYSLGLNQEEAKQAWNIWLDLYAKKDPKKAAKLRAYTGGGASPETRKKQPGS